MADSHVQLQTLRKNTMSIDDYEELFVKTVQGVVDRIFGDDNHLVFCIKPKSIHYVSNDYEDDEKMDRVISVLVNAMNVDTSKMLIQKYVAYESNPVKAAMNP